MPVSFTQHWKVYGGWGALLRSPYVWSAFGLTIVGCPLWLTEGWWDIALTVTPSMMGFALAVYALVITGGTDGFRKLLAGAETDERGQRKESPLRVLSASFTQFMLVQVLCLTVALICKAYYIELPPELVQVHPWSHWFATLAPLAWFFCVWLFMYSVSLTLAAAYALYDYVDWFDHYIEDEKRREAEEEEERRKAKAAKADVG